MLYMLASGRIYRHVGDKRNLRVHADKISSIKYAKLAVHTVLVKYSERIYVDI